MARRLALLLLAVGFSSCPQYLYELSDLPDASGEEDGGGGGGGEDGGGGGGGSGGGGGGGGVDGGDGGWSESGALCWNGLDDDGDGLTDCADPGCGMPCDDGGTFSYPPSNFDPTRYALPDASVVIRCKAELNSSPDAGGYLRGWCASSDSPDFYLLQQDGGEEALLAVMSSLTVTDAGTLALTGDRPVLLAVYGNAEIAGQLAAKSVSGRPPAGGSAPRGLGPKPHCALGTGGNGSYGNTTSGGGGGGAFGSDGAPGGAALGAGPLSYGVAGQQNGNLLLVPLRGGCAGGNGGPAERADKGGFGGGALQVSVAGTLLVTGRVAAPGEGGEGGTIGNDTGGGAGGGGSGGGVLLEASRLFIVSGAVVSANGGSGGEGDPDPGGGTSGNSGNPGRVDDAQAAPGGRGGGLGGDGGDGGTLLFAPTAGSSGPAGGNEPGGGGGGGSVGRIQLNVPALGSCVVDAGLITPAPAGNCP